MLANFVMVIGVAFIPGTWHNIQLPLEEKGQYVTITFTTTCNYLVFATNFLLSTTIVTSC
jgi:hypothetical protein